MLMPMPEGHGQDTIVGHIHLDDKGMLWWIVTWTKVRNLSRAGQVDDKFRVRKSDLVVVPRAYNSQELLPIVMLVNEEWKRAQGWRPGLSIKNLHEMFMVG